MKSLRKIHKRAATYLSTNPDGDGDDFYYEDENRTSQYTCDCIQYVLSGKYTWLFDGYDKHDHIKDLWKEYGMKDFGYKVFDHIPAERRQGARFDWLMLMSEVLKGKRLP